MNIEGTPHERALLVVFAYVIGFITAAIAFNYALGSDATVASLSSAQQQAAVATLVPEVPASENQSIDTERTSLIYENQGLYLYGESDFPTLLSKHIDALGLSYEDLPALADRQGFHTAVSGYEHYAVFEYVYYCEQYDTDMCVPYLYDTAAQQLYVVQDESGPIELPVEVANKASVAIETGLTLPGFRSVDAAQPWIVAAQ